MRALIEAMIAERALSEDYNTAGDIRGFGGDLKNDFKGKPTGSRKGVVVDVMATSLGLGDVNGPIQDGAIRIDIFGESGPYAFISFKRDNISDRKVKMTFENGKGKTVARQSAASKNPLYPHVKKLMVKGLAKL